MKKIITGLVAPVAIAGAVITGTGACNPLHPVPPGFNCTFKTVYDEPLRIIIDQRDAYGRVLHAHYATHVVQTSGGRNC